MSGTDVDHLVVGLVRYLDTVPTFRPSECLGGPVIGYCVWYRRRSGECWGGQAAVYILCLLLQVGLVSLEVDVYSYKQCLLQKWV